MKLSLTTVFWRSACVVLILTGCAKLISALGEAEYLRHRDPIFSFLSNRVMLVVSGGLELIIAYLLTRRITDFGRLAWIAWLSSLFILYRLGLAAMDYQGPCSCLGGAADWIPLSGQSIDYLMRAVLVYMTAGSVVLLIAQKTRLEARKAP